MHLPFELVLTPMGMSILHWSKVQYLFGSSGYVSETIYKTTWN